MDTLKSGMVVIAPANSLKERASSSAQRALADRLLLSEALEAVAAMLDASPYKSQAPDSYIGVLSKLLMEYPRSVALKCADPLRGVSRETKFLPTVAEVVAFCEKHTEPLRGDVDYERRVAAQFAAREEWQNFQPTERQKQAAQAWLDRTDPVAKHLVLGSDADAEKLEEEKRAFAIEANQRIFLAECAAAGVDPAGGVSPSLLALLKEQRQRYTA